MECKTESTAGNTEVRTKIHMRIGEFARLCGTTVKTLRFYDKIGLLKPGYTDTFTGYRLYSLSQVTQAKWILILKSLDFTLREIKDILYNPINSEIFLSRLYRKKTEINFAMDVQISKGIRIDKLINTIEREGFDMETINIADISTDNVNSILINMPNVNRMLYDSGAILDENKTEPEMTVIRIDIYHFKSVNDNFGHDVGDKVIATVYDIFSTGLTKYNAGKKAAFGRSHGDEFVAFALCGLDTATAICKKIADDMTSYDFKRLGCNRNIGLYYGMVSSPATKDKLRDIVNSTTAALTEARKLGKNGIYGVLYTE